MEDRVARMLLDNSLSDTARVLGVWIASWGEELREVSPDEFARIAHGWPSPDTIARHIRQLRVAGYIEQKAGGRGHSDRFRFRLSTAIQGVSKDRTESEPGSICGIDATNDPDVSLSTDTQGGPKLWVGVGGVTDDVEEGEEPPVVPHRPEPALSIDAERALAEHGELLAGCRGALRDYLRQRVPLERQFGYVMTVVGWRNGISKAFRKPDGTSALASEQNAILADALNDLAASDEAQMSRPLGDPANLRTKINVLLRQANDPPRPANGAVPAGRARRTPQSFDYSNPTEEWDGTWTP